MLAFIRRLYAIFLRQVYLIKRSPPRVISLVFWPTINMIIWGFLNRYLFTHAEMASFTLSTLLGATLLYNFFERSNIYTMMSFLEDIWARNLGNIMISPIRPLEIVAGYIVNGLLSVTIGVGTACILSYFIFDYSIFEMGIGVLPFMLNLILSGWSIGIVLICVIIRYGTSGEYFGWMLGFLCMPFIAVYYPVSILPEWMQYISWSLPPTYVFETLREYIATGAVNWAYLQKSFVLNLGYLALMTGVFVYSLNSARKRGGLLSMDAS